MKIIQPPAPTGDPTLPDGDGFPTRVRWAMREVHQTLGCFERSFRGRPRPVCDAERLAEVLARAGRARITLGLGHGGDLNLAHPIAIVDQRLRQLSQELALIRDQAHRGAPDERAGALAARLDDQLRAYRHLCAGRPRAARRPGLLRRIVRALDTIADGLAHLDPADTLHPEHVLHNRRLAADQVEAMRVESRVLDALHLRLSPADRLDALDHELDDIALGRWAPADRVDAIDEIAYQGLTLAEAIDAPELTALIDRAWDMLTPAPGGPPPTFI